MKLSRLFLTICGLKRRRAQGQLSVDEYLNINQNSHSDEKTLCWLIHVTYSSFSSNSFYALLMEDYETSIKHFALENFAQLDGKTFYASHFQLSLKNLQNLRKLYQTKSRCFHVERSFPRQQTQVENKKPKMILLRKQTAKATKTNDTIIISLVTCFLMFALFFIAVVWTSKI